MRALGRLSLLVFAAGWLTAPVQACMSAPAGAPEMHAETAGAGHGAAHAGHGDATAADVTRTPCDHCPDGAAASDCHGAATSAVHECGDGNGAFIDGRHAGQKSQAKSKPGPESGDVGLVSWRGFESPPGLRRPLPRAAQHAIAACPGVSLNIRYCVFLK